MAKRKNHTSHHQVRKNMRNGVKKPLRTRKTSTKGMNIKMLRNRRFAARHDPKQWHRMTRLNAAPAECSE